MKGILNKYIQRERERERERESEKESKMEERSKLASKKMFRGRPTAKNCKDVRKKGRKIKEKETH